MCQRSHQKYQQRRTKCHCHLQYTRFRSSKKHESTSKRPSHITPYSTQSLQQQRTATTRKQSQSLRWQRHCNEIRAGNAQLSGVPCASVRIKNINNLINCASVCNTNASDLQNSTSRQVSTRNTSHHIQRNHFVNNALLAPINRASP